MKILSLDTAMAACSAAVIDTDMARPLAAAFVPMERGHAEALPPMVAEVMQQSGLDFPQIDRIAVTTGPGTFTGVRIGLAFARGLALARSLPVVGIDSLSAIASNEGADAPLLVVSDARNDEVYAAIFESGRRLVKGPHVTSAAAVAEDVPSEALVLGSAAEVVMRASGRSDLKRSRAGDLPVAAQFARIAAASAADTMPSPLYLRAPDAKPHSAPLRAINNLTIQSVGSSAASLLSVLHGEIFEDGWTAKSFQDMLETSGTEAGIAAERGEPLGFIVTRRAADEAEIIVIGSRPSIQRRGVARQLLSQHVAQLAANGVRHLFLEVAASNSPAQALYTSCGFVEAGRRRGYYRRRDGVEDAIIMRRELRP